MKGKKEKKTNNNNKKHSITLKFCFLCHSFPDRRKEITINFDSLQKDETVVVYHV